MATLAEIRAQYPEYQDMSDQQLADGLYAKFYSDMPREEFDAKVGLQPAAPYEPSMLPWLDPVNAAANNFVRNIPVVGPTLEGWGNNVDAAFASMVEGKPVSAEERADINQAEMDQYPIAAGVGGVGGAVLPLMGAGVAVPAVGRILGMSGSLGSQMLAGGLSTAAISAADTKARGGDWSDVGWNAVAGGAAGTAAPLVFKGLGAGWNALTRQGVPKGAANVASAMADDGISPSGLSRALAQLGPDATVMDLGPNLQSLAGGLASVRGPAQKVLRDTVEARAAGGPTRMAADIAKTLGAGPELGQLTESIISAQKAAADPLYTAVRNVPVPMQGNIKLVADTPLGKRAFAAGMEMAANDGGPVGTMTIGVLDYTKRALDDIASAAARQGQNNAARQARDMARLLAAEGDKLAPGYQAAREAFAGPAAVLEAIETGRGTFKGDMSPAELQRTLANLTASEKDAFLQGAQTAVADMLGNSANDVASVRSLLRKPYNEAKMRALIGNEATDELLRAVDRELMFGQTANAVARSSETARRMNAQGMVNPDGGPDLGPQGTIGLVFSAINAARAKLRGALQPKVNQQSAEILTSGAPTPQQMQMLTRAQQPPRPLPIAPASLPLLPGQDFGNRPPLRIVVDGSPGY